MDSKVAYFKSIKSRSVAIMGANSKAIFYKEKVTEISDPNDIYIYRKKNTLLIETDANGVPINIEPGMVLGRDGMKVKVRPAPLSHSVYQGYEGAKRRQLQAEESLNRQESDKSDKVEGDDKADLDDELNAEDDLSVDSDDFNFEDKDEKVEKKKVKKKKKTEVKKDDSKKKKTSNKKKVKSKSSKKKDKKKKLDELREFSS